MINKVFAGVGLVLLLGISALFYMLIDAKEEIAVKESEVEELHSTITNQSASIDILGRQIDNLDEVITNLQNAKMQIQIKSNQIKQKIEDIEDADVKNYLDGDIPGGLFECLQDGNCKGSSDDKAATKPDAGLRKRSAEG